MQRCRASHAGSTVRGRQRTSARQTSMPRGCVQGLQPVRLLVGVKKSYLGGSKVFPRSSTPATPLGAWPAQLVAGARPPRSGLGGSVVRFAGASRGTSALPPGAHGDASTPREAPGWATPAQLPPGQATTTRLCRGAAQRQRGGASVLDGTRLQRGVIRTTDRSGQRLHRVGRGRLSEERDARAGHDRKRLLDSTEADGSSFRPACDTKVLWQAHKAHS